MRAGRSATWQTCNVVDNVRARFGIDHPQLKVFLEEHTIMQPGDMALDHIWEACESSLVGEAPRMHAQLSASRTLAGLDYPQGAGLVMQSLGFRVWGSGPVNATCMNIH
jgi:hypothetical protein